MGIKYDVNIPLCSGASYAKHTPILDEFIRSGKMTGCVEFDSETDAMKFYRACHNFLNRNLIYNIRICKKGCVAYLERTEKDRYCNEQ